MALALILSNVSVAQQQVISGEVVDAADDPLPYAVVIVLDTSSQRTLTYGNTDGDGRFNLTVDSLQPIILVSRYLGKRADSLVLTPPWPRNVTVRLADGVALPEIEITTDRPPITERGDTTTYDLADFRDSTDNKIEDVLRKLPGVEVNENGSIEVNGKAIQTILVEGTDLFGMDYQLASKNIRATDIGTVETIDHYQEDAVLRNVNFSEEVVLNLKLRPDKRAIVSGEVLAAAGAGEGGARYQLYAPLYRISRRNKTFTLLNTDNIAADNGLGVGATVQLTGVDALRSPLFAARRYYARPEVRTQGLPRAFTDNSRTLGGQIRHEYSRGAHAIFARLDGVRQLTSQATRQREVFVGTTERYELANEQAWNKRTLTLNGGMEYRFLSPDQRTSLRAYGKIGDQSTEVIQNFSGQSSLQDTTDLANQPLLLRLVATRQVSDRSVMRLELADQYDRRRAVSVFMGSDLSGVFFTADARELAQWLNVKYRQSVLTARWLTHSSSHLKVNYSTSVSRERLAFANTLGARNFGDTLVLEDLIPALQLVYTKGKWLHRLGGEYRFNQRGLNRYRASWLGERQLPNARELEVTASQSAELIDPVALLNGIAFAPGGFAATKAIGVDAVKNRSYLRATLRWENNAVLARTSLSLNANRSVNDLISDFTFVGTAVIRQPLVAPAQYGVGVRIYRSFFSLPLKSDVRLRASANYRAGVYQTDGMLTNFSTLTYNASVRTSWRVSRLLQLKGQLFLRYADGITGLDLGLFTGRLNTELIASYGRLRAYVAAFIVVNRSANGRSVLWNTYLGGRYALPLSGEKSLSLFLKVYNPLNRPTLQRNSFSGFFEREDMVTTTGGFGYLGCSFGL